MVAAIRNEAGLFCGSFLRKGEVLAYLGLQGHFVVEETPPPQDGVGLSWATGVPRR
jgi:hypothetical protein